MDRSEKRDASMPKRKRGAQPGNKNSKGHRNAAGHHAGAPLGNKNAEKDGAYSRIFFDMLTDREREIADGTPTGSREALEHELRIAKVREHRILEKIAQYEAEPEDTLHLSSLMDMRVPGTWQKDGENQNMGMYSKDTAFSRVLKLQEALYKVQGRITKIVDSLRSMDEYEKRLELEKQRLDILRMRATGAFDVGEPEDDAQSQVPGDMELGEAAEEARE